MALVINRALSDSASSVCFEVCNDEGGESSTVISVEDLSGTNGDGNETIIVKKVVATVVSSGAGGRVTLSWGDGTPFLHLPPGATEIDIPFHTLSAGTPDADVVVTATENTLFTLRIFANKMSGFPRSMGHARNRP
mgnify:CR=1 FL=1